MKRRFHLLVVGLALLGVAATYQCFPREELAFQFVKPDGEYRLVVYRAKRVFSFALPGGGSDVSGRVALVNRVGKEVRQEAVGLVNMVSDVEWENDGVSFQPFQRWAFPAR